jgi:hypothetical protein
MRQAVLVLGMFVGLGLMAGCGASDPVTTTIDEIINSMNDSRVKMDGVTKELKTAADKASGKSIEKKDLADAVKAMDELRKAGSTLHEKQDKAAQLKSKVPSERKAQLRELNQGRVATALDDLNKAYSELKLAVESVRKVANTEATDYLDEQMRTAVQEFESISRQK